MPHAHLLLTTYWYPTHLGLLLLLGVMILLGHMPPLRLTLCKFVGQTKKITKPGRLLLPTKQGITGLAVGLQLLRPNKLDKRFWCLLMRQFIPCNILAHLTCGASRYWVTTSLLLAPTALPLQLTSRTGWA